MLRAPPTADGSTLRTRALCPSSNQSRAPYAIGRSRLCLAGMAGLASLVLLTPVNAQTQTLRPAVPVQSPSSGTPNPPQPAQAPCLNERDWVDAERPYGGVLLQMAEQALRTCQEGLVRNAQPAVR